MEGKPARHLLTGEMEQWVRWNWYNRVVCTLYTTCYYEKDTIVYALLLYHPHFSFLLTFTSHRVPDASTLRTP